MRCDPYASREYATDRDFPFARRNRHRADNMRFYKRVRNRERRRAMKAEAALEAASFIVLARDASIVRAVATNVASPVIVAFATNDNVRIVARYHDTLVVVRRAA